MKSAVILCGGKGQRFGAESKGIQKCCVTIKNSTPIEMVINRLRRISINHFVFLTGFEAESTEELIRGYIKKEESYEVIRNVTASCTAAAMANAFNKLPEKFVYHHGNILLPFKYYNLINKEYYNFNRIFICDLSIKITHPVIQISKKEVLDIRRHLPENYCNNNWYYSVGMSLLSKDCFRIPEINGNIQNDKTTEQLLILDSLKFTIIKEDWMHIETTEDLIKYG